MMVPVCDSFYYTLNQEVTYWAFLYQTVLGIPWEEQPMAHWGVPGERYTFKDFKDLQNRISLQGSS